MLILYAAEIDSPKVNLSSPFLRFYASDTSRSTNLSEYPVCTYPDCDFVSVNRQAIALKVA